MQELDVAYFTASCDTEDDNAKFATELKLDYPILSDPDGKVATAYGVCDANRRLPARWTFVIGKDGQILNIDKKVSVTSHGADVAAKLKELGLAKPAKPADK